LRHTHLRDRASHYLNAQRGDPPVNGFCFGLARGLAPGPFSSRRLKHQLHSRWLLGKRLPPTHLSGVRTAHLAKPAEFQITPAKP